MNPDAEAISDGGLRRQDIRVARRYATRDPKSALAQDGSMTGADKVDDLPGHSRQV